MLIGEKLITSCGWVAKGEETSTGVTFLAIHIWSSVRA
jgi:hypothetical protein